MYTLNTKTEQTQDIAYSFDGGYTFEIYDQNPVISVGSTQIRDPKVIWFEDHWVMVLAYVSATTGSTFSSTYDHRRKSLQLAFSRLPT
jgi:beta-fructofuranosidase